MATYGSDNVVIEFDNSAGTLVDISIYVTNTSDVVKRAVLIDNTTLGLPWRTMGASTLYEMEPITLDCFYDDTASTGPWVLFNDLGNVVGPVDGRELKITLGSTKSILLKTIITEVKRTLEIGNLHRLSVVLTHSFGAAPTEA